MLIVGGGISGMALAIRMQSSGWNVDLVESDPKWRVYGAGISVTAPTYRAFQRLGIVDEVMEQGYGSHRGVLICAPNGKVIVEQGAEPIAPGLPTHGGILRPVLHEILSGRTRAAGTDVRLGVTIEDYVDDGQRVRVRTTDGQTRSYSLVVGADGVQSHVRAMVFPDAAPPKYTGQYCWRLLARRDLGIEQCNFYVAGTVTAGVMPVSDTQMYMFLLQGEPQQVRIDEARQWQRLKALMSPFSGVLGRLRDELSAESVIIARPLHAIILPRPWHRGRVVLIGDAAHATTPHLASGAGIAVEDSLVLSEELRGAGPESPVDPVQAVERFEARRFERCRMVVENSVRIGELELTHADPQGLKALMTESELALRADI
jgi:2-polyprenyl-6-methoxyphenol hydroxylase-like FAD-dependent oxidoreductase